ncbi:MAG TPA: sialidase family protein, partial [Thermoproteota archaeon]|nr:sialidase family protein [Thermoproteota archaeon]
GQSGLELLQVFGQSIASDTAGRVFKRTSKDNGRSWSSPTMFFEPHRTAEGVIRWGETAFLLDDEKDVLMFFHNHHLYPKTNFTGDVERFTKIFYNISWNGCEGSENFRQLIQNGYGPESWARGITFGKNNAAISFCTPLVTSQGKIVLPIQECPIDSDYTNPWLIKWQAGCFLGEWKGEELKWELSEMVKINPQLSSRGLCEPAIAELKNGALLMICRGSNHTMPNSPGYKWYAISEDDGRSWTEVSPFCYDDGSNFFSPSTGSVLIRSAKNRRLYWFGNIVPKNPDGNRPRYPLQVAEVNEDEIGLRKDSVAAIDDREKTDSSLVQFSNFKVHQDRETGEFVLEMARYQEKGEELTSPAYEYRIDIT